MSLTEIRLMSLTESDFLRTLPHAMKAFEFTACQGIVEIHTNDGIIRISLMPQSSRRIAGLSMPVLKVSIDFGKLPDTAAQEFMRQFDLAFHRGGG